MKFVIEIDGPKNENVLFAPVQSFPFLRGRWAAFRVAHRNKSEVMGQMSRIESIPGICVELDTDKRQGRIFDPLRETDEGRKIWREVQAVIRDFPSFFGNPREPWPETIHDRLTPDNIKTWLWSMSNLVAAGQARVVGGSDPMPSPEDVRKMPGKRLKDPMNTVLPAKQEEMWTDAVPEGDSKRQLAGAGAGSSGAAK